MIKKSLKVLLMATLVLGLVACGKGKDGGQTASSGEVYPMYEPSEYIYYVKSKDVAKEQRTLASELDQVLVYATFKGQDFVRLNSGLTTEVLDGFTIADGTHPMQVLYNKSNENIQREINITVVKEPDANAVNVVAPKDLDITQDTEDIKELIQKSISIQEVTVEDDDVDVVFHHDLDIDFNENLVTDAEDSVDLEVSIKNPLEGEDFTVTITLHINRDVAQPLE